MWRHDHPFGQRNKTTERAVGVGIGSNREVGLDKIRKRGPHKIGGLGPFIPTTLHKIC